MNEDMYIIRYENLKGKGPLEDLGLGELYYSDAV
jgi:hypothetical protein